MSWKEMAVQFALTVIANIISALAVYWLLSI